MPKLDKTIALTALMPDLHRLARILAPGPDAAEDLAQEALLKVWAKLDRGITIDDLRPYLMTTLRNEARRPRRRTAPLDSAPTPSTPADAPRRIACKEVMQAIDALPAGQSDLMQRYLSDGCSYAELACRTGLPLGTVTSRMARARARLCAQLDLPAGSAVQAILAETDGAATGAPRTAHMGDGGGGAVATG